MVTSLSTIFGVNFGNIDFIIVIFNSHGRKKLFSAISQTFIYENLIFGHFDAFSLNVQAKFWTILEQFPGGGY